MTRTSTPRRAAAISPSQHRVVGEIGADHVEPALGPVDGLAERRPDREVALARVVREDPHLDAARRGPVAGRAGDLREEPVEAGRVGRERPALELPRQEEHRLELGDDRPFEAEHQVVGAGGVVVLDAGAADVRDPPVDHDDLAMVEVAEVVEPPVDLAVLEQPVEVQEGALVRDDLHAAGDHRVVERLRAAARLAECRLRDDPDADALADLPDQQVAEAVADLARLEAEDQDVDVGRRRLDVGEHRAERTTAPSIRRSQRVATAGSKSSVRRARAGRPAEGVLDGQSSVARRR